MAHNHYLGSVKPVTPVLVKVHKFEGPPCCYYKHKTDESN